MRTRQRIAKLLFGCVLGVLLVELGLWFFPRRLMPKLRILDRVYTARAAWEDMMVGDPYLGYKLKPNLDFLFPSEGRKIPVRTVSLGFDGIGFRDIGTAPPFDAIAVGDSFTFCDDNPVAGCWVHNLAQSAKISIATLGVNGYGTLNEARVLERYGPPLKPKLIVLAVYLNDFKDNVNFDAWTRSGTGNFWQWMGQRRGRSPLGRKVSRYSMIYRVVDAAWRSRGREIHPYQSGSLDFVFRIDGWWVDLIKGIEHDRGWQLMQKGLLDMRRTAAGMNANLVVVLIPAKEEVYWNIAKQFAPAADRGMDVDHPLAVVRRFCQEEQIPTCEVTDALRQEAQRGVQLYHRISAHWNDAGNAVAAKAIDRCLADRGFLKGLGGAAHATVPAG